ncbi:hypothetical protein C8A03DRAFT_14987 [Achaetomium macrosporum]|uniref:DUF4238 domain-containing protein n=1 Tax=Achaetomium macrosporum TaxID=79813 RepID=A0AAN7HEA1_9PEZI|nr:hypothetical protein C8A03DRAFT_14987 [Achaetomium macrosporum]
MAATSNAQYQHFVPQFLLNNFSHPYKPDGEGPRRRKGAGKRKYEKGMYPKDPVVRNLDLLADPPTICEKPVKRILGQMNMYQDTSKPTEQQQHVELLLSKLEMRASEIFRKITKAFEQKEAGLWLTRTERNLLRKFLFLLKYRGDTFRHRFFHQNPEDYRENDRELLREYMAKHGFKRPVDVWFHNIKAIIELDMDPGRSWQLDLPKRMYPDDAMWFVSHEGFYYMAICTPSDAKDEFILTDNSYNIFEGPNHFVKDANSGELGGSAYTPLHEFAPVSPKLMIILRSSVLPNALEDVDPEVKAFRAWQRSLAIDMVYDYEVTSLLADLPIEKATNSYTEIVDGRISAISGADWKPRKDDRFCFRFFPICSKHVHTINGILLDNAGRCSSVVFESQESFARTLEWYLTAPCTVGKNIVPGDADGRWATLKKLESVSRALGSDKETVWTHLEGVPTIDYEDFRTRKLAQRRKLNRILTGGSIVTFMEDLTQAGRMWTLRVKIDSWSKGKVDEAVRHRNRELLLDAYLRLPPRRIWHYIRFVRFSILYVHYNIPIDDDEGFSGPEDAVVRVHQLVSPDRLARLIYTAGMNSIDMRSRPWLDLWDPFTKDNLEKVGPREVLGLARMILFYTPGIPEVQDLARQAQLEILRAGLHNKLGMSMRLFDEGDRIELLTRMMVRESFMDALRGRLEPSFLLDLKTALFDVAYPTPPQT